MYLEKGAQHARTRSCLWSCNPLLQYMCQGAKACHREQSWSWRNHAWYQILLAGICVAWLPQERPKHLPGKSRLDNAASKECRIARPGQLMLIRWRDYPNWKGHQAQYKQHPCCLWNNPFRAELGLSHDSFAPPWTFAHQEFPKMLWLAWIASPSPIVGWYSLQWSVQSGPGWKA